MASAWNNFRIWIQLFVVCSVTRCLLTDMMIHRPGRHICTQEKVVMTPVKHTQTYCRPEYQRSYRPCQNSPYRFCQVLRLSYRLEYRTIFQIVPRHQRVHSCCPGWRDYSISRNACINPVCNPSCRHGGTCFLPGKCTCPDGWNGTCCEEDVNECLAGTHGCQQVCENTEGGYECRCYDGFNIKQDGKSCELCLSCNRDFKTFLNDQKQLENKIFRIEENYREMHQNLSQFNARFKNLTSQRIHRPYTTPPGDKFSNKDSSEMLTPELEALIVSLSEQIGMLEERLNICTCQITDELREVTRPPSQKTTTAQTSTTSTAPTTAPTTSTTTLPPVSFPWRRPQK